MEQKLLTLFFVAYLSTSTGYSQGVYGGYEGEEGRKKLSRLKCLVKCALENSGCKAVPEGDACAIVYDDEDCQGWSLVIKDGERRSFSTWESFKYQNEIGSLSVKKGCTLTAYDHSNFTNDEYAFVAPPDNDLHVKNLDAHEDSRAESLDENIESLECSCPKNRGSFNQQGSNSRNDPSCAGCTCPRPSSSNEGTFNQQQEFRPTTCRDVPSSLCAIVYDDSACQIEDWDAPVNVQDGQEISWSSLDGLSNIKYKNTIESVAVRKGCRLSVYDDSDFEDDEFVFEADRNVDLFVTLDSPSTSKYSKQERRKIESLDDDIESLKCYCN